MSLDNVLTIPEAAQKYGVDVKRLRGIVWRENLTGALELPIGSFKEDKVQDDERLEAWASSQR
jgi:hypothetical protein